MERDMRLFLAGLAGAGAMTALAVAFPNISRLVTIPLAVACIMFSGYCLLPELKKFHAGRKYKVIPLIGMSICGAGFFAFLVAYFLATKSSTPAAALTSTANTLPPSSPPPQVAKPVDESLPGFAFAAVFAMSDMAVSKRQYLFEYGTPEGARVAFYISRSDRFTFLVTDRNGETYPIEVPLGKDGIPIERTLQLYCDVGSGSNYSFIRVFVNGEQVERRDLQFPIDMGSRQWVDGTLGANMGKSNNASFAISELIMWPVTLPEFDRQNLTQNEMTAFNIFSEPVNPPAVPPLIPAQQVLPKGTPPPKSPD